MFSDRLSYISYLFFRLFIAAFIFFSCKNSSPDMSQPSDFCSSIHRNEGLCLSEQLADLQDSMKTRTGAYVLEDGGNSLITRAWLSEYAESSIDIQYFIFSTDNVGLIACDYLVRAADRGVRVRILVDDIMVDARLDDILMLDSHENITIRIYNPGVNLGKNLFQKMTKVATDFRSANQRMHNKTFIVDKQVVITGGRNLADEYFDYDHEYNFRDRDVLLVGKVTSQVNNSFELFWNSSLSVPAVDLIGKNKEVPTDPHRFDRLHEYACNPENFWPQIRTRIDSFHSVVDDIKSSGGLVWVDDVEFVSDEPGKNDGSKGLGGGGKSTDALIRLIREARTSIDIQSPYLVTTVLGKKLLADAVERGVKVRILTNSLSSTDNVEAFSAYQSDRKRLLELGIHIFEFRPDAAERIAIMTGALQKTIDYRPVFGHHAKSMVVDGKIAVIGTFNLDPRSANLNTECVTIIHSPAIAQGVLKGMETEFLPENSWEVTVDFNPDSLVSRAKRFKTWTRKVLPRGIL